MIKVDGGGARIELLFFREAAATRLDEVTGSLGRRQGVTGGVARQDGVGHIVEGRLLQWEEEDRDGDVGADCGSSREGGGAVGRKGERMSSKSPRPEHRGGGGHGMSKSGCSPLTPSTPSLPGTPASEESSSAPSPSRTFRGARPATPWGGNRGLQRFSSHPHLPGLLGD